MRAPFLLLLPALCGLALAQYPAQVYGVDVSDPVSTDDFSCLNADNLTFAIVRVRMPARPLITVTSCGYISG